MKEAEAILEMDRLLSEFDTDTKQRILFWAHQKHCALDRVSWDKIKQRMRDLEQRYSQAADKAELMIAQVEKDNEQGTELLTRILHEEGNPS